MLYATNMASAIFEYKNILRQLNKHGFPEHINTASEAEEYLSEQFYELLQQYDIPDL